MCALARAAPCRRDAGEETARAGGGGGQYDHERSEIMEIGTHAGAHMYGNG